METCTSRLIPEARREGILTKEVTGEMLVYDFERDRAHCLNVSAAAIWRQCDGHTGVSEIAEAVSRELAMPLNERMVHSALRQLSVNHLLTQEYKDAKFDKLFSRRSIIRKLGVTAALWPIITSITAPTAMAAISCSGSCTGGPGRGTCSPGCLCSVITNSCVVA